MTLPIFYLIHRNILWHNLSQPNKKNSLCKKGSKRRDMMCFILVPQDSCGIRDY